MNKQILRLAIPNIISNITIPLLGMVDMAILGHLESEIYLGAIALGGMIFNFLYFGFGFLRMGTAGFTAQAYGEKNKTEIISNLGRPLIIAMLGSLFIIFLQKPIALFSFYLLNGSEQVELLAKEYFYIRIFAAPAALANLAILGWFLGMQNAKYPMIITLVINALNLGFNALFVYGMGMKSDGVAWGTLLAQYRGLTISIVLFLKKYRSYFEYYNKKVMLQMSAIKKFLKVNTDLLIRTLLLLFAFSFFTAKSAEINDTVLAVNNLLLQYLFLFSYLIDGFAHAAEALIGKFIGAKEHSKLKGAIRLLMLWGIIISVPFSLFYIFAGKYLLMILTDIPIVIETSAPYLPWLALMPVITFAAFIWDGIFIGATASKYMRNIMIMTSLFLFLPSFYLAKYYIDHHPLSAINYNYILNHVIWFSMTIFMLSRSLLFTFYYKDAILKQA